MEAIYNELIDLVKEEGVADIIFKFKGNTAYDRCLREFKHNYSYREIGQDYNRLKYLNTETGIVKLTRYEIVEGGLIITTNEEDRADCFGDYNKIVRAFRRHRDIADISYTYEYEKYEADKSCWDDDDWRDYRITLKYS